MKEILKHRIENVLKTLGIEEPSVVVEPTEDLKNGDYATSVALAYAKHMKMKPADLAKKILAELEKAALPDVEKMEIAGPGFINFYLTPAFFTQTVKKIITDGEKYGHGDALAGQKIMIEFTDANPFKQFHAGHVMANAIGESLARIIEASGAEVKRACYQGDVGLHIAKTIWGMKNGGEMPANGTLSQKTEFLGAAYVRGAKEYEENQETAVEIKTINKKIFEKTDPKINELYDWGRETSLAQFEVLYKKLGTKFDYYFFESEMAPLGMFVVEELVAKDILEKSDGAIVFKGESYGLHTRVFVNSEGLPTYETKELGLNKKKFDLIALDRSIIVTGNEQSDYFKVLLKVMEFAFSSIANRTRHISHGMLRFADGKMSSRTGNILTGEALLAQAEDMIMEKIKDREMTDEEKKDIAEIVAVAAIKYSILRQAIGRDIIFEFDTSLSFEGDSGPYLQYAATRAGSVLHKAAVETILESTDTRTEKCFEFERKLHRFPEIVARAQAELAPQYIATYLIEIAAGFNNFYAEEQIVKNDDATSAYKVALTHACATIIKNGLHLLGIRTPEKM